MKSELKVSDDLINDFMILDKGDIYCKTDRDCLHIERTSID